MDVVVDIRGEVVVDNVRDIGNVETTGCDGSGYQDGSTTSAESLKSHLTFALSAIPVDGGRGNTVGHKEVGKHICHPLGFNEDECEAFRRLRGENIKQYGALIVVLHILDFLSDVLGRRPDAAYGEEDVIF
jgi:hypothetical protein